MHIQNENCWAALTHCHGKGAGETRKLCEMWAENSCTENQTDTLQGEKFLQLYIKYIRRSKNYNTICAWKKISSNFQRSRMVHFMRYLYMQGAPNEEDSESVCLCVRLKVERCCAFTKFCYLSLVSNHSDLWPSDINKVFSITQPQLTGHFLSFVYCPL